MSTTVGEAGEATRVSTRVKPFQKGVTSPRGGYRERGSYRNGRGIDPSNRGNLRKQGDGSFRTNNGNRVGQGGLPSSTSSQPHGLGGDQHSNQFNNPTMLLPRWPQQQHTRSASTRRDSAVNGVNPPTNPDRWGNGSDKISRKGNHSRQIKDLTGLVAWAQSSHISGKLGIQLTGRPSVNQNSPNNNSKPMARFSTTEDSESVAGCSDTAGVRLGNGNGQAKGACINYYDRIDPQIHIDSGTPLRTPASILEEWRAAATSSSSPPPVAHSHSGTREGTNSHHTIQGVAASPPRHAPRPDSTISSNHIPAMARSMKSSALSSGSEHIDQSLPQDRQTMNLRGETRSIMSGGERGRHVAKPIDIRRMNKRVERTKADRDEISRRMSKEWLDLDQHEEPGTGDGQAPAELKVPAPLKSATLLGQRASATEVKKNVPSGRAVEVEGAKSEQPDVPDERFVAATEAQKAGLDEEQPNESEQGANLNEPATQGVASSAPGTYQSVGGELNGGATSIRHSQERSEAAIPSVKTSGDEGVTRLRLTSKNLQHRMHAGVRLEGVPTGGADLRIDSWRKSVANTQGENEDDNQDLTEQEGRHKHLDTHEQANKSFTTTSKVPSSMADGGLSPSATSDAGVSNSKPQRMMSRGESFRIYSVGSEARVKKIGDTTASITVPKKSDQNAAFQSLVAEARQRGEKPDFGAILRVLQEQEAKRMGAKENDRKGHPRHVDCANLQKARRGPGTIKGSHVMKEIDRCRNERYQEQLPSPEDIKLRCEIKMAEPMNMDNQVLQGEIYDLSRRRWKLGESGANHLLFCDWLKLTSALKEPEVHIWDEKFQEGRLHIISQQWYEPGNQLENVFKNVDSCAFYAAPWTDDDTPLTVLSLEDELSYEHRHETSAGYMHNWMAEDDRVAREEEQRQEKQGEHSKSDAERQQQDSRVIQDKEYTRSVHNAHITQGEVSEPCSVPNIYIRPMESKDIAHIVAIHNYYIDNDFVHEELCRKTTTEIKAQWKECADEKLPFLIAATITHGTGHAMNNAFEHVLGFACVTGYSSSQSIFKFAGRVSLFVAPGSQNEGVGTCLLERLLMILDDKYVPKNICHFDCAPNERYIYLSGKVRPLRKLIFTINYPSDKQCEYKKWIQDWLTRRYGFEKQGCLRGVGNKGRIELDCDILVRGVTPYIAHQKKTPLGGMN